MAGSSLLLRRTSRPQGLSLVELTLALVLLTAMLVSLAKQTGIFVPSVSSCAAPTTAADISRAGVGLIDLAPSYTERCVGVHAGL